ncbi:unnamed protein product [Trypanosoma congolense IL3000]|uniref:WGS project CAEQ00000000 data, annotated contig 414 n=1 Tax=Trypanosoma congolense (strain IL3000) TaxID=1068625 RepID=F9WFP8_TRYCI|nr:unnamed protein product [Trypanosoma congolense IL3000]
MVEEHPQQAIFSAAEGDHGAVFIKQMAGGGVQAPAPEPQQPSGFGNDQVGRQHARTAQHSVDARQQFTGGERLDQVIVGAHFQADDAIGFVIAGGQHQHRRGLVFAGANVAAEHQAIVAGHHDVQHDQVYRRGLEKRAHLAAIRNHGGPQAVLLQVVAYHLSNLTVIVHDEDVINVFHGPSLCQWELRLSL